MTFTSWGGESQQAQMKVLEGFTEASGATIVEDGPTNYAKLQAQVENNQVTWDVVTVDSVWAAGHCDLLLAPDESIIDGSEFTDGLTLGDCGVPADIYGNVLAFDRGAFAEAPTRWADFFDTQAFPGKRAVSATNPTGTLEAALLADGVKPDDLYPLDVERALDKLDTIRDDLVFWSSGAEQEQIMGSGQAAMGIFWSGRVGFSNKAGSDWGTVKTQPINATSWFVVPKGARDPAAAMALINYWLGAEQGAEYAELTSYETGNRNADPDLDAFARDVQVTSSDYSDQVWIDEDFWAANLGTLTDRWIDWTNG
ncbi:extracellular solute-binding protein [Prauserella endophytica]|uniref:extracellular solute-binding protein n=1 Tax=Prauserella endophytica TaxID=1592324 RepID=UPI0013054813|nr:extracellular solute-binding protein [Prauserella endophytica]